LDQRPNILVVDDDGALREQISDYLAANGCDVEAVSNAPTMDAALARRPFDVVVLDVMMPGLGGSALASIIAKLELPHVPKVLLWSAMDDVALADAAKEAGGLPWVSKAMRASDIAAEIERIAQT
jgi:two-component system OmpR family response regulator